MVSRGILTALIGTVALTSHGVAAPITKDWVAIEVTKFEDFDRVEIVINGQRTKSAYLVGLRPLRDLKLTNEELDHLRGKVRTKFAANTLFAQILTEEDGDVIGISVDAFAHSRNDFKTGWLPSECVFCWSGWGAYNLNTYFLASGVTEYLDNLGRDRNANVCRKHYRKVVAARHDNKAK